MRVIGATEGVFWCVLFFILGPTLIFVNNHILNRVQYKYPIVFSSLGIWGTATVCHILEHLGMIKIQRKMAPRFWLIRILPLGLLSAATIATGNSVYLYLSVSFTQMLKALTPVYILICLAAFKVEFPTRQAVFAVCLISLGTIVSSLGELRFSLTGFLLQTAADLFEGSRLVLIQMLLSDNGLSPVESLYYIYPATGFSQFLMVLLYERSAVTDPKNWKLVADNWPLFLFATLLGIGVNFVGANVIKHTSSLMLKLVGVVRNNCLVLLSILFLGDTTTAVQIIGYVVSVGGFIWYANLTMASASHNKRSRSEKISRNASLQNNLELDDL